MRTYVSFPCTAVCLALFVVGCGDDKTTDDADISDSDNAIGDTATDDSTSGGTDVQPPTTDVTTLTTDPPPVVPVCDVTADSVVCPYDTTTFSIGLFDREVHHYLPNTPAPAGGYPVVMMFQGSFFTAEYNWDATTDDPHGAYHQAVATAAFLDAGFAVITPETKLNGATFWDTNVTPYTFFWESSDDHELMLAIFGAALSGTFGDLQTGPTDQWYATGMSSGGYMTSRMALAYPGRFAALGVVSGSYATCSGPLCLVGDIPADHPPTLFVHGDDDLIVPMWTMEMYQEALDDAGIENDVLVGPGVGHDWFEGSGDALVDWFLTH